MPEETKKPRKQAGRIRLYSVEEDCLKPVVPQPPPELRDEAALKRWLARTLEIEGRFVFLKEVASCSLKIDQVVKKTVV